MRPDSARPIFALFFFTGANCKTNAASRNLAFSTLSNQHSVSGHHHRRQEEESRNVRVSVWWDFENCNLPVNSNVFRVAQCITNAVRANAIRGPIHITAFGDVMQMSRSNQEALCATGINISHVPSGGKNSADRSLLVDLMYWVSQNPPPAHIFLISSDRDYAGILHRLRMNNYNILLASQDSAPSVLCSAATIMWQWSSLLKGNISGKLYNQPPDGSYNSWYGTFRAPLEDPFAVSDQWFSLPTADELSELKLRPVPKSVVKHIRQILSSHPEGIPIRQLRIELSKIDVVLDKDLYGAKKWLRLLLSMPHVVKVLPGINGYMIAQGVNDKLFDAEIDESEDVSKLHESPTSGEDTEKPVVSQVSEVKDQQQRANTKRLEREEKGEATKGKGSVTNCNNVKKVAKVKDVPAKNSEQESQERGDKLKPFELGVDSPPVYIEDAFAENEQQAILPSDSDAASEVGFIKKIWRKLFRNDKHKKTAERCSGHMENLKSLIHGNYSGIDNTVTHSSGWGSNFVNQLFSWFSSKPSKDLENKVDKSYKAVTSSSDKPEKLEIFCQESFLKELRSFIDTATGASVFLQSSNRKQLVENLQQEGPQAVKALSKDNLLDLVDILISEKKWAEEGDSQESPFRIISSTESDPQKNLELKQPSCHESAEQKHQDQSLNEVIQPVPETQCSNLRSEMLVDCRKLVDQVLKEHPDGYKMGNFQNLFSEKYGYSLDLQKLGYKNLVNLMQIMPGVRIESELIFPSSPAPDSESSVPLIEDEDSNSPWDELGPVYDCHLQKIEKDDPKLLTTNQTSQPVEKGFDYEPADKYEFSESEEETSPAKSTDEAKCKDSVVKSSLLDILDLWSDSERGKTRKDGSSASTCGTGRKSSRVSKAATRVISSASRRKIAGKYSFVVEQPDEAENDGASGILGILKRSECSSGSRGC